MRHLKFRFQMKSWPCEMFLHYFGNKVATARGGGHCCNTLEGIGHWEGDDGEMSWFNARVKVGVGIHLGMCLG